MEIKREILLGLLLLIGVVYFVIGSPDKKRPPSQSRVPPKKSVTKSAKSKNYPIKETVHHNPPPLIPLSKTLKGKAYVIDGDTIIVSKTKIRLAGIDAPELDQPWGQKSKWEMVKICKGHVLDIKLTGETTYDRLVGYCYLPDGRDIGAEIVKAGLALDGGYYSKGKYRHLEPHGIRRKLKPFGNRHR